MAQLTQQDILFNALAYTPVRNKRELQVGDRVRVLYKGHESITQPLPFAATADHSAQTVYDNKNRTVVFKVEEIVDGAIESDGFGGVCIKLIDATKNGHRKYASGELKNFKKGWDGNPGVGASWGGTSSNSGAFLSLGCKIIGYQR